jgi:hypothetical protein
MGEARETFAEWWQSRTVFQRADAQAVIDLAKATPPPLDENVRKLVEAAQALLDAPFPDEETPAQYVTQMAIANLDASDNLRAAISAFTPAKGEGA